MMQKPKRDPSSTQRQNTLFLIATAIGLFILLIAGIISIALSESSDATPTHTPITSESNIEATPVCFWNWATNLAKSEHIDSLNEVLTSSGYEDYELTASAYGEDKICQVGDEIVSSNFYMMDISPTITLTVDSADTATLSTHIRQIITGFQASDTLPKINRVEIIFSGESDPVTWRGVYQDAVQAISDEISDDDLLALGQG
jgi:hypothetical protein